MTFLPTCTPRDAGAPGRSRVFVYLALAVSFLLLSYQLVLNHETFTAVSHWALGKGPASTSNVTNISEPHLAGLEGLESDSVEQIEDKPVEDDIYASLQDPENQSTPNKPPDENPGDILDEHQESNATHPVQTRKKEVVFAAMRNSNMSWVEENLPEWYSNIYRVDMSPSETDLTVPLNKGNEAMVYLTYLIDRYWTLPDVVVFVHGARYQWHNDNPSYDAVISLKDLKVDWVREAGYVNLRCTWVIGCPVELEPARYFRERPDDVQHPTAVAFPDSFMELLPGTELPETIGIPCCSQFAVSREAVHAHDRDTYIHMQQWLLNTPLTSDVSGRVFEYVWHILFGQSAQHCPDMRECYCRTYGYCDMSDEAVQTYWTWRGLVLPEGWPDAGAETGPVKRSPPIEIAHVH
ncbi:hypothetical protein N7462_003184 [Penicillium macrosclerotiorum]|uniref:uncharacterized protein n=1 Tax=Penicillium macrosclerotiorum TaxID=303699 RepID=UPI002548E794|nr:uncharacterized protein N7462_003184 [Penicillium macrosclerotiorum]KAJ5688792.1 hypothetical protein N7462_003184 [Penicillium macrosclerotiorum]